jgi:CDP-4-dehydro-6-deoxyglucose reductase
MTHRITLQPSGNSFDTRDGESILEAALRQGLILAYGCKSGACGSCKAKLIDGEIDQGAHQATALSTTEFAAGMRLLCCARATGDCIIAARVVQSGADIRIRTLPCRVEHIDRPAADVAVLRLKLPANDEFEFLAGQYIDMLLKDGRRRSFSLANPPHQRGLIELHVRAMPGGAFSQLVWNSLKPRDILRFEGPFGVFFLRQDSPKHVILLASGTGFAPIKAIVQHAFEEAPRRQMVLYWGGRRRSDLYALDLAETWAREHDNFRFVPVLSEPDPADDWLGRTGLVHEAVLDDFVDLESYQVYACGNPLMIEAAQRDFTRLRSLPTDEFYCDKFTQAQDR